MSLGTEGMHNGKGRLKRNNENRTVQISKMINQRRGVSWQDCTTYPTAKVLQSECGARAVMGSYMVRDEMCSFVVGSKRIIFPCEFPVRSQICQNPNLSPKNFRTLRSYH